MELHTREKNGRANPGGFTAHESIIDAEIVVRLGRREMNYIAHAYISQSFDLYMLGQLLGDFSTRQCLEGKDPELTRGVQGHRALDEFTDQHPSFIQGCEILKPASKRYSPVVMDILLDYILVINWAEFSSNQSFQSFIERIYQTIDQSQDMLPERMARPASRMSEVDWFSGFSTFEGFKRVLYYTSKRVRYPSWITVSADHISQNIQELEKLSMQLLKDQTLRKFKSNAF